MSRFNPHRFILCGLVAGLVSVGGGLLLQTVFREEITEAMSKLSPPGPSTGLFVLHVGVRILFGFAALAVYVTVRRSRPSRATSVVQATVLVWFLSFCTYAVGVHGLGAFPARVVWILVAWGLVECLAVVAAGAMIYRDRPVVSHSPPL